jgi:hypothetical protein
MDRRAAMPDSERGTATVRSMARAIIWRVAAVVEVTVVAEAVAVIAGASSWHR